ncbi:pyruvate, phosphate dikinase [Candidatus Shapirobacteria bacterium]|nr:pyruvate, phosphate dikinase [Candidatus Shapirobacteria bacterium]
MVKKQWVFSFNAVPKIDKNLLGGKGAGLAEMTKIGLPVPPGFIITTDACKAYQKNKKLPPDLWPQIIRELKKLEEKTGKRFNDAKNPLLVSVRSGAPVSMPGMMDTVLNLGLNDETAKALAKRTKNSRFAADSYRRFIQMFANIVKSVPLKKFEDVLEQERERHGFKNDTEFSAQDLEKIIRRYQQIYQEETGEKFPQDPLVQLQEAIKAVFNSWENKRAIDYRNFNKIPHHLGTAVNVQAMVFGNMGEKSATGVAFTRNPAIGKKKLYGEFLINAQGEDVVAGIRTPRPIKELAKAMPKAYEILQKIAQTLEKHFRDMQDIEFTIEEGKFYILQTRSGKRTPEAAVKIAYDMVLEKLISKEEAIMRLDPDQINQLLHRHIDHDARLQVIAKGLAASPGGASGEVVLDADKAESEGQLGNQVILVRPETSPDDVHGVIWAQGVLTSRGGTTSHAAVVARGLGRPCVCGAEEIKIDLEKSQFTTRGQTVKEGEVITLNGSTGEVILGAVPMVEPKLSRELKTVLSWADEIAKLKVYTNADYPRDAKTARDFGAKGIGLCRTEHMFMEQERLPHVQKMILAPNAQKREEPLEKIGQFQKEDFVGLFRIMDGSPVIIRLIDPPLHEFLPKEKEIKESLEKAKSKKEKEHWEAILTARNNLHEDNPMLGLRGCRLGILMPEIIRTQTRAILEAALKVRKEGKRVKPQIMVPLVAFKEELALVKKEIIDEAEKVFAKEGERLEFKIGTMIELPRAALRAGEIAEEAEFFSFGTNDLTQTTIGISRDDAEGKFLASYQKLGIIKTDPFQTLDQDGVGELVEIGTRRGRKINPDLSVGICGEHGGDPESIKFCHQTGLNYVSCSPYRVPAARLVAAQAAIGGK